MRPQIGMRVKLAARGGGRWQSSGGYRSKFGLTVTEILRGLEELKSRGMEDCFKLLHFHLGSQIPNIRIVKGALNEAARIYVELAKQRRRACEYMDVGGGLGVDYDGSQTNFESSINYTLAGIRQRRRLSHPDGLRRGGRAASDDRLRERPRDRRVPQRARVQRARRVRLRRRARARPTATDDMEQPLVDLHRDATATSVDAQRARELSRRAAGARHGDQPVHRRLPVARAALPGREPVLGDLRQAAEAGAADGAKCPRSCRGSTRRSRTRTSATSRCSSRFPTAGRSSSCSRSCRSTG